MSLAERFSNEGREAERRRRRELLQRIDEEAPEMAAFMRSVRQVFSRSSAQCIVLNGEVVYGEPPKGERIVTVEAVMDRARIDHRDRVRALGCIVSGTTKKLELHHCHGGSVSAAGFRRGMGQKTSEWLIIPIAQEYHTGKFNPEVIGITRWEAVFGTQMDLLREVSERLGYDVIARARTEEEQCKSTR